MMHLFYLCTTLSGDGRSVLNALWTRADIETTNKDVHKLCKVNHLCSARLNTRRRYREASLHMVAAPVRLHDLGGHPYRFKASY